jgi:hypothetical protein
VGGNNKQLPPPTFFKERAYDKMKARRFEGEYWVRTKELSSYLIKLQSNIIKQFPLTSLEMAKDDIQNNIQTPLQLECNISNPYECPYKRMVKQ